MGSIKDRRCFSCLLIFVGLSALCAVVYNIVVEQYLMANTIAIKDGSSLTKDSSPTKIIHVAFLTTSSSPVNANQATAVIKSSRHTTISKEGNIIQKSNPTAVSKEGNIIQSSSITAISKEGNMIQSFSPTVTSKEGNVIKNYSVSAISNEGNAMNNSNPTAVTRETNENPLRLLVWNKEAYNYFSINSMQNCNHSCIVTRDNTQYNQSDAVIFRLFYILPNKLPKIKPPKQKWIYFTLESPARAWKNFKPSQMDAVRNMFSVSSTYGSDSDVPVHVYTRRCTVDQRVMQKEINTGINYALNKQHKVAWFVSHCSTKSKREAYVKELQKTIPVHIFGHCGNLSCAGNANRCNNMLRQYKFYLAFENAICDEYATEKLARAMDRRLAIIPVVLGGANYSYMLPRQSYIDVHEFSSPAQLGQFLLQIDKNDTLFSQYIRTVKSLRCTRELPNDPLLKMSYQCRLCKHLHDHRKNHSMVSDVVEYWSEQRRCMSAKEYYKNVFAQLAG